MDIVIASSNLHKVREFRQLLKEFKELEIYSLKDFPSYIPPEETGETFEENASLKAPHASKALKKLTIADDSGLVVPALDGAPGVRSARYAGNTASDQENRQKLIAELSKLPEEKRIGFFECSLALALNGHLIKCVSGKCEGNLLQIPKGSKGFGYDSMFIKNDYNKTFAEIEEELKNKISHRRKAFDRMIPTLYSLCHKA